MEGAFLFPQMSVDAPGRKGVSLAELKVGGRASSTPRALFLHVDRLLSDGRVLVLTRWAKLMMMVPAIIAFGIVILLLLERQPTLTRGPFILPAGSRTFSLQFPGR